MSWKLAIFDWDGTLVDSRENAYRGATAIFDYYGVPVPTYAEFLRETNSDYESFYHKYGIPKNINRRELNAIWKPVFESSPHPPLREGAKEAIADCKATGFNVAVVSGNIQEVLAAQAAHHGIFEAFDLILADACGKTDELRETLLHFERDPHEAFYVDDTIEGLSAARALGVYAIGIENGFQTREELLSAEPDRIIASLEDLGNLLHS